MLLGSMQLKVYRLDEAKKDFRGPYQISKCCKLIRAASYVEDGIDTRVALRHASCHNCNHVSCYGVICTYPTGPSRMLRFPVNNQRKPSLAGDLLTELMQGSAGKVINESSGTLMF